MHFSAIITLIFAVNAAPISGSNSASVNDRRGLTSNLDPYKNTSCASYFLAMDSFRNRIAQSYKSLMAAQSGTDQNKIDQASAVFKELIEQLGPIELSAHMALRKFDPAYAAAEDRAIAANTAERDAKAGNDQEKISSTAVAASQARAAVIIAEGKAALACRAS